MLQRQPPSPPPSFVAILSIVGLATALGTILGGLSGMQAGALAGLLLSFAPYVTTRIWSRIARHDNLARLPVRAIADGVLRAAAKGGIAISKMAAPPITAVSLAVRLPILIVRFVVLALASLTRDLLARLLDRLVTPLGIANIGALVIILADMAGSEAASFACFVGLVVLILVLMVSESESLSASS